MAKTKKRKKAAYTEPVEVEKPKPEMPDKILKQFLEEKCSLSKLKNISMIRAGFLWQKGSIERYRINVWQTTYEMGEFCPDTKIIYSYFVFYYPEERMVVNKTIEPVGKGKDLRR